MHSLLHQWEQERETLGRSDVLVIDEAGMIGSRQMERVLSQAQAAGAKVVLVGDPEQLQAIEAGAAFRAIAERVGVVEITEVRRQREEWQQQAMRELATGRTDAALARYETAGMVRGHGTLEESKAAVVAGWNAARRESPEQSQIILAYRRADVADLNAQARAVRRESRDSVRAYAERRGLAPESAIVVARPTEQPRPALGQTLRARLSQGRGETRSAGRSAAGSWAGSAAARPGGWGGPASAGAILCRAVARRRAAGARHAGNGSGRLPARLGRGAGVPHPVRPGAAGAGAGARPGRARADRMLPRGAEVLEEALQAGRVRPAERVKPERLREAARERQDAHGRSAAYRQSSNEIAEALRELERGWSGTESQRERHAALVRRQWTGAREAVADEGLMAALERTAAKAATQARTLAAQPEAAVDERVRAQGGCWRQPASRSGRRE